MRLPISVVILTKNEESNIRACIDSLRDFPEVFVVDSNSSDKTVEIAKELDVKVVSFDWNGKYPKKKHWAILNLPIQNDWVLFLDADERVSQNLVSELKDIQWNGSVMDSAFKIKIDYFFNGNKLKHGHQPLKIALVKVIDCTFPALDDLNAPGSWEVEGHYQPIINGSIGKLINGIIHNDNDSIDSWFFRHINYAKWQSYLDANMSLKGEVAKIKSRRTRLLSIIPFKGFAFFVYSFVFKLGFLDGKSGLNYALANAWYYWLVGLLNSES